VFRFHFPSHTDAPALLCSASRLLQFALLATDSGPECSTNRLEKGVLVQLNERNVWSTGFAPGS
jgi:hypothetical protein